MKRPFAVFTDLAIAVLYCITVQAQEIQRPERADPNTG